MAAVHSPEERALIRAIADNGRKALSRQNITMCAFAAQHNIPQGSLSTFLGYETMPSLFTTVKMAHAMGVSLDWLCGLNNMDEDEEDENEQGNRDR